MSEGTPKARPIVFSGEMVRAILEGRKTMTRRICKLPNPQGRDAVKRCRYGVPGDRLWVQEGFALLDDDGVCWYDGKPSKAGDGWFPTYRVDADESRLKMVGRWYPGRFMSRWASRILLEVTEIRVERLHAITDAEARAEGVDLGKMLPATINGERGTVMFFEPRKAFAVLWNQINGKGSWESNPWVWKISFRRVTP